MPGRRPARGAHQLELGHLRAAPPRPPPAAGGRPRRSRRCRSPAPPRWRPAPRGRRRGRPGSSAGCARSASSGSPHARPRAQLQDLALHRAHRRRAAPGPSAGDHAPAATTTALAAIAAGRCARPVTRLAVVLDRRDLGAVAISSHGRGAARAARPSAGRPGRPRGAACRRPSRGESPGSSAPAPRGASHSESRPSDPWSACRRRSSSASSRSAATTSAPLSRKPVAGRCAPRARREGRPALARGQAQPQRGLLAEVGLGDRREHPRGDARGAGAGLVRARPRAPTARAGRRARRRPGR